MVVNIFLLCAIIELIRGLFKVDMKVLNATILAELSLFDPEILDTSDVFIPVCVIALIENSLKFKILLCVCVHCSQGHSF